MQFICSYQLSSPVKPKEKNVYLECNNKNSKEKNFEKQGLAQSYK